jgi:hypothetical protein
MSALHFLALLACNTELEPYATATQMDDLSDGVGGPKALAQPGDFILENDQIRVAVTSAKNSMGPSLYGGSIIDADLNRHDPQYGAGQGNDRLAELFPTVNLNVPYTNGVDDNTGVYSPELAAQQVQILSDGSDGGPAVIRANARHEPFLRLLAGLWALVSHPDFSVSTDYILEPGENWVTLRTTAYFADASEGPPDDATLLEWQEDLGLLDLALENGIVFGDFFLQGGDVDVFSPDIGFWEDGAVYEAIEQGQNTFTSPFELEFVAGTSDGVSYGLATLEGTLNVPLFTSSQTAAFGAGVDGDENEPDRFPDGAAYTYERIFVIGHGDVGSVLDGILRARDTPRGVVHGNVFAEGTMEPVSGASVLVYAPGAEAPFSQWETDVAWDDHTPDGSFQGFLPVGDWELVVHQESTGPSERFPIVVKEGRLAEVALSALVPGTVTFQVIDESGIVVPAKLSIFPADGGEPIRDPVLGDGYISGSPQSVVFAPYGNVDAELPPGDYTVWATRGPEYELGRADITVRSNSQGFAELQVIRSVDTTGWISADFHVHSQPSHDSGVSAPERVYTMVSEQVEFLLSSDHDFITDFRPVIEDLGMEHWITSTVGLEVTTVEVGHFIGFPLTHDYLAANGGAFDWTGETPYQMLTEVRALGDDPVIFVAHPRDGILGYFDQFGFSPYGGTPGEPRLETSTLAITNPLLFPDNFTLEFDAVEMLGGKRFDLLRTPTQTEMDAYAAGEEVTGYEVMERTFEEQDALQGDLDRLGYGIEGQLDDWFTLLNLGYTHTVLGNSDTHGKTSTESGCPRNYVVSSTDDPAYIDADEIAQAVRDGHVVASYGPFVRFVADDTAIVGDTLVPGSADVEFYIEVQSPTWFDMERVEIYRNGLLVEVIDVTTPNSDVLNVAQTWTDTPDQDSWYVVIAMGSGDMQPLFTPVEFAPIQLQDVVIEALGTVEAVSSLLEPAPPNPRTFPVYPFAVTNPIWVDLDGNGFDAPGVPDFMLNDPVNPNGEEE